MKPAKAVLVYAAAAPRLGRPLCRSKKPLNGQPAQGITPGAGCWSSRRQR